MKKGSILVKYILSKIFENYTEDFLSVKLKLFYKECKKKKNLLNFFMNLVKTKGFHIFIKPFCFQPSSIFRWNIPSYLIS